MSITIRAFAEADESAVIDLLKRVLPDSAPHNDPRASIRRKLAVDRELLLVAEAHDRTVIGTVMGGYDGHRGWVYSLAVDPAHRRRGVGAALLRRLEALLAERGCPKVNLQVRATNAAAVGFYEKLGYVVEGHVSLGKRLY